MSWIATAIIGSSVVSGLSANSAADSAASASDRATQASIDEQRRQFDITQENMAPWLEAGGNALLDYQSALGPSDNNLPQYSSTGGFNFDLEGDQGYQFALQEALKATDRAQTQLGGYNSGGRLAALNDRAVGTASQYANDAFNRQLGQSNTNYNRNVQDYGIGLSQNQDLYGRDQDYLNRLASLSGLGQTTASNLGTLGANTASNIGNALTTNAANQGNAALTSAAGINNAVQGGISNYMLYDYLNP